MKIAWKKSALQSLIRLDTWREANGWSGIGGHLVEVIESYFHDQDMSIYVPGRKVSVKRMPVNMRMTLISPGKSDPYKVFFRIKENGNEVEIFLVRHPHQKPLY